MKIEAYKAALDLAAEDEALAAAIESSDSLALAMSEDGGVTIEAGEESVTVSPEDLMGDDESAVEVEVMPG